MAAVQWLADEEPRTSATNSRSPALSSATMAGVAKRGRHNAALFVSAAPAANVRAAEIALASKVSCRVESLKMECLPQWDLNFIWTAIDNNGPESCPAAARSAIGYW